jgi:hypothetical protein
MFISVTLWHMHFPGLYVLISLAHFRLPATGQESMKSVPARDGRGLAAIPALRNNRKIIANCAKKAYHPARIT